MRLPDRRLLLVGGFLATVVAAVYPVQEDDGDVVPAAVRPAVPPAGSRNASPPAEGRPALRLNQRGDPNLAAIKDPFTGAAPVQPKPEAAPPPPPPSAPPLPFSYKGKLVEEAGVLVILAGQSTTHVVKVGDTIEQHYRVDAVGEQSVTFTYLPLDEQQTLPIGNP